MYHHNFSVKDLRGSIDKEKDYEREIEVFGNHKLEFFSRAPHNLSSTNFFPSSILYAMHDKRVVNKTVNFIKAVVKKKFGSRKPYK